MTDLKHGVLDVNGYILSQNTTVEALAKRFPSGEIQNIFGKTVFKFPNELFLAGTKIFYLSYAYFSQTGQLLYFIIAPAEKFCGIDTSYNGQIQETRIACKKWLEKQLGKPTKEIRLKTDKSFIYRFAWGDISCMCQYIDFIKKWSINPIVILFSNSERSL